MAIGQLTEGFTRTIRVSANPSMASAIKVAVNFSPPILFDGHKLWPLKLVIMRALKQTKQGLDHSHFCKQKFVPPLYVTLELGPILSGQIKV